MGVDLGYNAETQIVYLRKEGATVEIPVGERYILINGKKTEIDTEAVIIQGRTYLPIRAVAETFGYKVYWRSVSKDVYIYDTEQTETIHLPTIS